QQRAVVERLQEPTAIALAKGDNSLQLAEARSEETRQAYDERDALVGKLLQKYKAELPPSVIANFERRRLEKITPKPKRKLRSRNNRQGSQFDEPSWMLQRLPPWTMKEPPPWTMKGPPPWTMKGPPPWTMKGPPPWTMKEPPPWT